MTDCLINELINTKNEYNRLLEEMEKKEEEIKKKEEEIRKKEKKIKSSLRLYHKGNYNKVNVIDNEMNDEQKNFAIDITRKSLNMHENDHFECVKYITEQFDNKYGRDWCVFLSPRNFGSSYFFSYDNGYIKFTMGEFLIVIFKSGLGDKSLRLHDKGNYNKVNVIDNKMNDEQKNFAIDITRNSLNMHKDDHCECANYIKDQFVNKYGGSWCVFIRPRNYGNSFSYHCDNCYICFTMGEFSIVIFKSSK